MATQAVAKVMSEKDEEIKSKSPSVTSEDVAKYIHKDIRTSDDAVMAYLQGDLEEDELRKALAVFGVTTLNKPRVERIDAAYERKIPDDLFDVDTTPYDDFDYRKDLADAKQEERDEAVKATEGETRDETVAREQGALQQKLLSGETGSKAGNAAADKSLAEKGVEKPAPAKEADATK